MSNGTESSVKPVMLTGIASYWNSYSAFQTEELSEKEDAMNEPNDGGYALGPGEGRHIYFRGTRMSVKVSQEQSQGDFSLIEMEHPPSIGPALHVHPHGHEAFYVLDGEYTIRCGQQSYVGVPGSFVFVPKGVAHSYHVGPKGGRVLVISPAGLEKYFEEVSEVLKVGPISPELEDEIARRHGQEFLDSLRHWGG